MSEERALLVTAPPRSGTLSVAQALLAMGLDVGHECIGPDGSVSAMLGFPSADAGRSTMGTHLEGGLEAFRFRYVARILRHPLGTIGSLAEHDNPHLWRFVESELGPVDRLLEVASYLGRRQWIDRAARAWLAWEHAITKAWGPFPGAGETIEDRVAIRIDDLPASLAPIAAWLDRPIPKGRFHEHQSQHLKLSWQVLACETSTDVFDGIVELARREGYA